MLLVIGLGLFYLKKKFKYLNELLETITVYTHTHRPVRDGLV